MDQTDRPDDRRAAGSRLSSDSESAVKGITKRRNPEFQNARKPRPDPSFLAKSNTCPTQITATNQSLPNSSRTTTKTQRSRPAIIAIGTECEVLRAIQSLGSVTRDNAVPVTGTPQRPATARAIASVVSPRLIERGWRIRDQGGGRWPGPPINAVGPCGLRQRCDREQ
jgi:hypothetical protein